MSLTRNDAVEALRMAETTQRHSLRLRTYQCMAPHLMLWGVAYAVAYAWGFLRPAEGGLVWLVVVPVAILGDVGLASRMKADGGQQGQMAVLLATFLAFVVASAAVMQPHDPRQVAAFVPLVVAAGYVIVGVVAGWRMAVLGVALGALTLAGYFVLAGWFMLWMSVVGGGALLLGGLWLRRA